MFNVTQAASSAIANSLDLPPISFLSFHLLPAHSYPQAHSLASEVPLLGTITHQTPPQSILARPLSIYSAADATVILRALSLHTFFSSSGSSGGSVVTAAAAGMSPATPLFTQLRSYPRNAGEAEGAKRVLWGVLGRVADAVHQVFKRLAAMKVGGSLLLRV
jgi:hypothetical protein